MPHPTPNFVLINQHQYCEGKWKVLIENRFDCCLGHGICLTLLADSVPEIYNYMLRDFYVNSRSNIISILLP